MKRKKILAGLAALTLSVGAGIAMDAPHASAATTCLTTPSTGGAWVDGNVTRQKGAYGLISVDVGTCQSTYSFLGFATIWYSKSGGVCTNTETARTTKKTAVQTYDTLDLTMVAPAGLCFRMQYKNDSGSTSYARLNY
jgi:hypothetical protein